MDVVAGVVVAVVEVGACVLVVVVVAAVDVAATRVLVVAACAAAVVRAAVVFVVSVVAAAVVVSAEIGNTHRIKRIYEFLLLTVHIAPCTPFLPFLSIDRAMVLA